MLNPLFQSRGKRCHRHQQGPLSPLVPHSTTHPPHLALRPRDVDDVQSIQVLDL